MGQVFSFFHAKKIPPILERVREEGGGRYIGNFSSNTYWVSQKKAHFLVAALVKKICASYYSLILCLTKW